MVSRNTGTRATGGEETLMICSIEQLEDLFAVSRADLVALADLQGELRYRQTPRALALLNRIQSALVSRQDPARPRKGLA